MGQNVELLRKFSPMSRCRLLRLCSAQSPLSHVLKLHYVLFCGCEWAFVVCENVKLM